MKTALMIAFLFMGQTYNIELAITPVEQINGLMYRKEWTPASQGMLFVNTEPRRVSFWMKNTYLNMYIMYLDPEMNLLESYYPNPLDETSIPSKSTNIMYILELNPEHEPAVRSNWVEFKTEMKKALDTKEKDVSRLRRPL
ncbi:MAG: DUF192 domain-containing protein [Brevinema sp.]